MKAIFPFTGEHAFLSNFFEGFPIINHLGKILMDLRQEVWCVT